MIEYDKERVTDLAYVKELLEGKYIKDNITGILKYFKTINTVWNYGNNPIKFVVKWYGYVIDNTYIDDDKEILIGNLCIDDLENTLKSFSFTTKEEFMNSCNKVMEKIQKGVEKNE